MKMTGSADDLEIDAIAIARKVFALFNQTRLRRGSREQTKKNPTAE
jgi:hypothetical protein